MHIKQPLIPESKLLDIVDIEIDGIHSFDAPDFCDAFISSAGWNSTGEDLTEEELDYLNENYSDFVYDCTLDFIY